jgi:hypothetical protein
MNLEGLLKDPNGTPIAGAKVYIRSDKGYKDHCMTDSSGRLLCKAPKNETINITAYDDCGIQLLNKDIGPFTADVNVGSIITVSFNRDL